MMRRSAALLAIVGAGTLVFVLSRQGGREGRDGAEPQPDAVPAIERPASAPAVDLSAPEQEPVREAISPSKPPKKIPPSKPAQATPTESFVLRGKVIDDVGAPVTSFSIDAEFVGTEAPRKQDAKKVSRSFEDQNGSFTLDVVAAGQWQLTSRTQHDRRSPPAVISTGGSAEVVLVIPRSGTISGFVVGLDRAPVGDAKLYLHYPGEAPVDFRHAKGPEPRAQAGPSGGFLVEHVPPGTVEIMARHPDFSDGEWKKLSVAPGSHLQDVEVQLTPGARIEGHVDPSLGEVADRQIDLFSFRGGIGWRETRTDAAGHFVIEHVVPQDYVMELRPAGYGDPEKHQQIQDEPGIRKNLSVKEGETTRVVFGEARRQIAIHGMVLTAGAPAPGLSVRSLSKENEDRGEQVETGPDGRFELTVAGAGDYRFSVAANNDSYVSFQQAVPDQSDLDVVFEVPSGALSGRVTDKDGRPLSYVGITLVRAGYTRETFYRDSYRRTHSGGDGSFHFRLLAPGSYTLRAPDGFQDDRPLPRSPHGRVLLTDLTVDNTELSGIEVHLPIESRISGVVVDAIGNPVTDAWVGALDSRGISLAGDGWETRTDATGHFEIANVALGAYSVRARSGEKEAKSPPFEVEAGKTATTRIEIR